MGSVSVGVRGDESGSVVGEESRSCPSRGLTGRSVAPESIVDPVVSSLLVADWTEEGGLRWLPVDEVESSTVGCLGRSFDGVLGFDFLADAVDLLSSLLDSRRLVLDRDE